MPRLTDLLTASSGIFLVVDGLALAGGAFFLWRTVRRAGRFAALARRTSFKAALGRGRRRAHGQAVRCATDVSYYLSRLALMFCANLVSVTGAILAAITVAGERSANPAAAGATREMTATIMLLLFAVLVVRNLVRTVRLARKVMEIRRRRRMAAARNKRCANQRG